jgi:hypothetical protein
MGDQITKPFRGRPITKAEARRELLKYCARGEHTQCDDKEHGDSLHCEVCGAPIDLTEQE